VTVKAETTVTTTTHMPLPIKAEPGPGELGHTETIVSVDTVVTEFEHNMQRAFKCGKCGNVVTFQRKGKGGTVKCPHCQTSNFVTKLEGKD
jgi:DNA-directed RNA polymerase subunit RPC12/RpoP